MHTFRHLQMNPYSNYCVCIHDIVVVKPGRNNSLSITIFHLCQKCVKSRPRICLYIPFSFFKRHSSTLYVPARMHIPNSVLQILKYCSYYCCSLTWCTKLFIELQWIFEKKKKVYKYTMKIF